MNNPSGLPNYFVLPEPDLSFHPDKEQEVDVHPLRGLSHFGPFSQHFSNYMYSPIRVAAICPFGASGRVKSLLRELEGQHAPQERRNYLIPYSGFSKIFKIQIAPAADSLFIELDKNLEKEVREKSNGHIVLADALNKALSALQKQRTEFDVVFIYLPEAWSSGFYGGENDDFDLHDFLKGITATRSIPLQIIRDNALTYNCRASVMWRLGIALYCKAGGVPWRLANVSADTAYIGISYAVRNPAKEGQRFVTCCSQVFDAEGAGLEFIAYDTNEEQRDYKNPYLSRTEMRSVMARSLRLYQQRHGGRTPKTVTIHKGFDFTPEEIEGCFDAWRSTDGLQIIQIQANSMWRGLLYHAPKQKGALASPAMYPIFRGSVLPIDDRSALLWTQGNAPSAAQGKDFFKEGKSIPKPLLLTRFAGHGSWENDCNAILGLSKMNWNNDGLYDLQPVTIGYADVLARTIKRIPDLAPRPYEFRFFM